MSKSALLHSFLLLSGQRHLTEQEVSSSNYTSPPLPVALDATPAAFRSDDVISAARSADAIGNCTINGNRCQIPFPTEEWSKIGVLFYPGGLVDPRSYAPIATILNDRYGLPVVIPIFDGDSAYIWEKCDSGRFDFAKAEFPHVQKWIFAGHSWGGVAAMSDLWQRLHDETTGGLVSLASAVYPDLPRCKGIDYSNTIVPMASLIGSLDGMVNKTQRNANKIYHSNATFWMDDIYGANHASFGAYNVSDRFEAIGQVEEEAMIPGYIAWDLTATAIAHVASRMGVPFPQVVESSRMEATNDETLSNTRTATTLSRADSSFVMLLRRLILGYRVY